MNLRSIQPSSFALWLRTGRHLPAAADDRVEVKHNPWHDPENGQFTYADAGRRSGSGGAAGGGGGTFDGGGASSHDIWRDPPKHLRPKVLVSQHEPQPIQPTNTAPSVTIPVHASAIGDKPYRIVMQNGYEYQIDTGHRMRAVTGVLGDNTTPARSRTAQIQAGGADRRSSDDGGHYIAARFNGPTDAFNHFAQDANFNRGRYRALEDQWNRDKRANKIVIVKIVPVYYGASQRPSLINVWFTVNGRTESERFANERKGTQRGK